MSSRSKFCKSLDIFRCKDVIWLPRWSCAPSPRPPSRCLRSSGHFFIPPQCSAVSGIHREPGVGSFPHLLHATARNDPGNSLFLVPFSILVGHAPPRAATPRHATLLYATPRCAAAMVSSALLAGAGLVGAGRGWSHITTVMLMEQVQMRCDRHSPGRATPPRHTASPCRGSGDFDLTAPLRHAAPLRATPPLTPSPLPLLLWVPVAAGVLRARA